MELPDRFWRRVEKSDDCWNWIGARYRFGYGAYWHDGRNEGAHRLSWIAANGPIPDGLCILHRCDNPGCVNPAHLFLGTIDDNNADRIRKGRDYRPIGDLHHLRILSSAAVREIRRRLANGERGAALAREFGVHPNTVYSIKSGRNWGSVRA